MKSFVWFLCGVLCGSFATLWFVQAQSGREQAAFRQGYEARDREAYSQLHLYTEPWTVLAVYSPYSYDFVTLKGEVKSGVIFCEPRNLQRGWRILEMQVMDTGPCLSLSGPKAYLKIEKVAGQPIIHQIAMQ